MGTGFIPQSLFYWYIVHVTITENKKAERTVYHKQWREKNREAQRAYHLAYYYANKSKLKKQAIARGEPLRTRERVKRWKQENPDRVKINGKRFREKHIESERARNKKYWADNKDKIRSRRRELNAGKESEIRAQKALYAAKYRERDRLTGKQNWLQRNPERRAAIANKYKAKNGARYAALAAKRRAKKLQATPVWADHSAIAAFYEQAESHGMTVDHTVPLQGKNVCGLHVENNLQLLTKSENSRKRNKFENEHALSAQA
jgi:hypothetical protein